MATAFFGYVLPWGQMSFWGAKVITSIFGAIPVLGPALVTWLVGSFTVDAPTLNRFFSLHYLLPFVIAALVALHIWALHVPGNNNPTGVNVKDKSDTVPFHPYYTVKDGFAVSLFVIVFAIFVFFMPDGAVGGGQQHRRQPAGDARAHRARVVPACPTTRSCAPFRTSSCGVIALALAIGCLFALPWLDTLPRPLDALSAAGPHLLRLLHRGLPRCSAIAAPTSQTTRSSRVLRPSISATPASTAGLAEPGLRRSTISPSSCSSFRSCCRSPRRRCRCRSPSQRRCCRIRPPRPPGPRLRLKRRVDRPMLRKLLALAVLLAVALGLAAPAVAATTSAPLQHQPWSFSGPTRHVRPGPAAARLQGLHRGLLAVSRDPVHPLPQPR